MSIKLRLVLSAAVALVAIAAVASSASAFTASISPSGSIESPSNGKLTFGNSPAIECNLTLNGSLAAGPITVRGKEERSLGEQFGQISEVKTANCVGGSVGGILELPWPLTIESVGGTLPNEVTNLTFELVGSAFNLSTFFELVNCLYKGNSGGIITALATRTPGVYTTEENVGVRPVELPFIRGSALCPSSGPFRGSFKLFPTQTITVS